MCQPQSRQSARFFLQSSELGLPLTRRRVCPSPVWFREGTHSLGGEGTDTVLLEVGIYVLWGVNCWKLEVRMGWDVWLADGISMPCGGGSFEHAWGRCTEAEFIIIHFVEVYGHNFESYQTWSFCMDFLNRKKGDVIYCHVFLLSPLQCIVRNWRNCKRLREFEEIEISRQNCRGDCE